MLTTSVETFGEGGDALRRKIEQLMDTSNLMRSAGELLMDSEKKNIEESRMPDGTPFAPLKIRRPAKLGAPIPDGWSGHVVRYAPRPHPYGRKPLLDTTNMYQSIHYEILSDHEVFAGPSLSRAPYFPFQNQGTHRIPARTFIGVRNEDYSALEDLAVRHVAAAMN